MRNIVLLGMKHSGKTALGKILATNLSLTFVDTDALIEEAVGMTVRDYYKRFGQKAFMTQEALVCKTLLDQGLQSAIIATGGGVCANSEALSALRSLGKLIYLNVELETCFSRIMSEDTLPAYLQDAADPKATFEKFFTERTALYKTLCDIAVDLSPSATKEENAELLGRHL